MRIKLFNYREYSSYELLETSVNEFLSDTKLNIIGIQPIRLSNNPATDSIMVKYKEDKQ